MSLSIFSVKSSRRRVLAMINSRFVMMSSRFAMINSRFAVTRLIQPKYRGFDAIDLVQRFILRVVQGVIFAFHALESYIGCRDTIVFSPSVCASSIIVPDNLVKTVLRLCGESI